MATASLRFVARKNGTLAGRAVGHGGGWGDPNTSEESLG
jgi:hypothetical protein